MANAAATDLSLSFDGVQFASMMRAAVLKRQILIVTCVDDEDRGPEPLAFQAYGAANGGKGSRVAEPDRHLVPIQRPQLRVKWRGLADAQECLEEAYDRSHYSPSSFLFPAR
jgi:hypothetical protein